VKVAGLHKGSLANKLRIDFEHPLKPTRSHFPACRGTQGRKTDKIIPTVMQKDEGFHKKGRRNRKTQGSRSLEKLNYPKSLLH
jgi:hypothetical protein